MNVYDTIQADQIEVGDQIIIDGEEVTVVEIRETNDNSEVVVIADSFESGDRETYSLPYDYDVDLWAV